MNILPTNEATLPTFTCSASSNHENITHEMSQYCLTTNILSPENYPLYGIYILCSYIVFDILIHQNDHVLFNSGMAVTEEENKKHVASMNNQQVWYNFGINIYKAIKAISTIKFTA